MRVWIGLLVIASVGCKKKADSPAAGSAGSGVAAAGDAAVTADAELAQAEIDAGPPLPAFCVTDDDADNASFDVVASEEGSVTFCFALEDATKCARLELATGAFSAVHAPAAAAAKPAAPVDAAKLGLPKGHEYMTATSPDGKTIAATSEGFEGQLFIVDVATSKVRTTVKWEADGGCMESPSFIGDNIYVQYNVCAGPGATGWIVSPDGKKLGSIESVNPTGTYFAIGGTQHAFEDFSGDTVAIVDGRTGKTVREIKIAKPEDCEQCPQPRTGGFALAQAGSKLVQFTSIVALVDPTSGKVERTWQWPRCAKTEEK